MKLETAVEEYIARKRLMGRRYVNVSRELRSFVRMHAGLLINKINATHISLFLNCRPVRRSTWARKHAQLKAFFSYWLARQEITRLPMPHSRPVGQRIFSPYIYSRSEIRALLRHSPEIQNRQLSQLRPETFRLIVILLYATGMWVSEALSLRVSDLDLKKSVLTLSSRAGAPRQIPVGPQLNELLRQSVGTAGKNELIISTKRGSALSIQRIDIHFRRVRTLAGITRNDGSKYHPTLRDLRHTFAVNRVCDWYQKKENVDLMLPRMASYMGLRTFPLIEKYLSLAPAHFKKQVRQLRT
jgi:integrase/recombinase XerD